MKRGAALAAALLAATTAVSASTGAVESADAIVAGAMDAPSHVSYDGTVEVLTIGKHGAESAVFEIEHRAPDRTRKRFSAPASVAGDSVVVLGNRSYDIDVKRSQVVAGENDALLDPGALAANYKLMQRNYRAVARPGETFAGRAADVVDLVNDYSHRSVVVVRIDRATKLVLDKQEFGPDGALIGEMRFVRVRFGAPMPDADFAIPADLPQVAGPKRAQPSQDVAGVVARAGFPAHDPSALPLGFAPVEGSIESIDGVRTVHVLCSDGLRSVSLFQAAKAPADDLSRYHPQATSVAGHSAQYAEKGPTTILAWSSGDVSYTLVGEMQLDELSKIAASLP